MKKRLICFTLIIAFVLSLANISYAAEDDFSLLGRLGINIDYTDNETQLTRAELSEIAISITGVRLTEDGDAVFIDVPVKHKEFAVVNTAYKNGLMSGYTDMTFRPYSIARTSDAVGVMLVLLGYGGILKSVTIDKYNDICQKLAVSAGLYNGVEQGALTKYRLGKMLLNMLEAEAVETNWSDNSIEYNTSGDEYLTAKYGYEIVKGTLQAVGEASLMNIEPTADGYVKIAGKTYSDGGADTLAYLGQRVKAVLDNDSGAIISIKSLENKSDDIEIKAEDIISYSGFEISYEVKESVKTKTISQDSRIIINGRNADYDEGAFRPIAGSVLLKDTDSDEIYDTAIITSEIYAKVSSISENTLTDLLTNKNITLKNKTIICYADGVKTDINTVSIGMLVRVSADAMKPDADTIQWIDNSKSEKITVHVIAAEEVDGKLTGYTEEDAIIDDTQYEFNSYTKLLIEQGVLEKPSLGSTGKFYMDEDGRLLYFDVDSSFTLENGMHYGYVTAVGYDEDEEDKIILTLVNEKAERVSLKSSDNFRFNDVKTTYSDIKRSKGTNTDLYVNGELRRQLVMYRLNEKGELQKLYTAKDYANTKLLDATGNAAADANPTYKEEGYKGYDNENFSLDFTARSTLFRAGFNHLYHFSDNSIAFIVPKNPNNYSKYSVLTEGAKALFTYNTSYSVSLYNVSDSYAIGVALQDNSVVESADVKNLQYNVYGGKHQSHIITGRENIWDDEESELKIKFTADHFVYNSGGALETTTLLCDDETLTDTDTWYKVFPNIPFSNLECGDILHYYTDADGKVERFRIMFRASTIFNSNGSVNYRVVNSQAKEGSLLGILSRVVKINTDGSMLLSYSATDEYTSLYYCNATVQAYLYDLKTCRGQKIDMSEIEIGDTVFTRSESGRVMEIFVYR